MKIKVMKNLLFFFVVILQCNSCFPQDKFKNLADKFKNSAIPIENILKLSNNDTLDGKLTNDILIREQQRKPQYLDKAGTLKTIKQYYGLYPEEPFKYGYKGEQLNYYSKIISIGKINLDDNFESLIIKVIGFETTFYDLWNFSKDGKALSVVCLFWGMRDAGPRDEKVTFIIVDSKITKEGDIVWHENADGLETFRTYRLNSNGYFQIKKEETKGETEF